MSRFDELRQLGAGLTRFCQEHDEIIETNRELREQFCAEHRRANRLQEERNVLELRAQELERDVADTDEAESRLLRVIDFLREIVAEYEMVVGTLVIDPASHAAADLARLKRRYTYQEREIRCIENPSDPDQNTKKEAV